MKPDFQKLQTQCAEVHDCSPAAMHRYGSRGDQRRLKKAREDRRTIETIARHAETVYTRNPDQDPEYFTQSVIALLTPWLFRWMISALQNSVIRWFANRLFSDSETTSVTVKQGPS